MRILLSRIVNQEAFKEVFELLDSQDAAQATEIKSELQEVLNRTQKHYAAKAIESGSIAGPTRMKIWEQRSVLLQEMLNLKAHMKRYTDLLAEFAEKERELRQRAPALVDAFFDKCSSGLDRYFDEKQHILHQDIDSEVTWVTEPKDKITRIVHGTFGVGVKSAGFLESKLKGFDGSWASSSRNAVKEMESKAQSAYANINPESTLTQIWNRYMTNITMDVESIFSSAWQQYDQEWQNMKPYAEVREKEGIFPRTLNSGKSVAPEGVSSPAVRAGQGGTIAATAATFSLAMGWHTLSYSVFHVFPPAMVFSLLAAAWTGKRKEESYRNEIKNQFSRCLHLIRQDYVRIWFEGSDSEGRQAPLRTEVMRDAAARVEISLQAWQRRLFGKLDVGDYVALVHSVENHLALLEAGLTQIDDVLGSLSRERNEYPKIIEAFNGRYPGLDAESLGMLATGEVLLQMHIEQPFYECSPIALPFTKVLERELYRVFREQFGQQGGMPPGKEQKFMLGAFLVKARCGEIKGFWQSDFLDNLSAANLVRCSMAHRDPISFERAMKLRNLVVGQQGLLHEIIVMGQ